MIILVSEIIFNNNKGYQPGVSGGIDLYVKTCETKILKLDWKKKEIRERVKVKMKIQM